MKVSSIFAVAIAIGLSLVLVGCSTIPAGSHYRDEEELHDEGKFEEAVAEFDEAIRLDPKHAQTLLNRAGVYLELGKYSRAIEDLDQALLLDADTNSTSDDRGVAHEHQGSAYYHLGQYYQAIQDYNEAIRLDPNSRLTLGHRAIVFTLLGKDVEAEQDLNRAVELGMGRKELEGVIQELKFSR